MEKETFIVAQKAAIRKGDKLLILKRSPDDSSYPSHWDFPGGTLETGEDPKKGLEREVLEESALVAKTLKPVFTFREIVIGRQVFFVVYECTQFSGNSIKLSGEHMEYRWATREEILGLKAENYLIAYLKNKNDHEAND